jgi:dimethylhistidine N-methyltransferase
MRRDYPRLHIDPVIGDFTTLNRLSTARGSGAMVGFFPGSTIGNFAPGEAVDLLARIRRLLGPEASLIVGVDQAKDSKTLTAAYNDAAGVTAAFNLNLLARINRELEGELDLTAFRHLAVWNAPEGRIEMHLEVTRPHQARVAGRELEFVAGETIHTENSYKFTPARFAALARRAGWRVYRRWVSSAPQFAVYVLAA